MMRRFILAGALVVLSFACTRKSEVKIENPVLLEYSVHSSIPHSIKSFTEGFVIHHGELYEGTGEFGTSWIGVINVKTGEPDKKIVLSDKFFGEGITILNNKIYQLTWREHTGFVYSLDTYKQVRQFTYKTEGWGLTHDTKNLIMSDGSSTLHFLDTVNLAVVKTLEVMYNHAPLNSLNELEYVDGFIYANVWKTDMIVKIDAASGVVAGFIDLSALTRQARILNPKVDLLNGIAWHTSTKSLLVTGKYWPKIYVLKLK
jgi:glutamine cyclotransferase